MTTCPDCRYLISERAAIHEFDGKATREDAKRMASTERCEKHRDRTGEELALKEVP